MTTPPCRPNTSFKPPAAELRLDSPVQFVRGVGPQRAKWRCLVSKGQVAEVMSMTDEGKM